MANIPKMISQFLKLMQGMFARSNRIHMYPNNIRNTKDVIYLIDRFVDGSMVYEMEWDDFISWKNTNTNVENIRNTIGNFEPLLFSTNVRDRALYVERLI